MEQEGRSSDEREMICIVSYLYYYADMNQSEIANRLFLSRSTISRLLKKARSSGIVELKINEPWQRNLDMEDELKKRFHLDRVRVLKIQPKWNGTMILEQLGKLVAYYFSCIAEKNIIVGMSWGKTITQVVNAITTGRNIPFTVVPIMGSRSWPQKNEASMEMSYTFSQLFGARYLPLDAPLYASGEEEYNEITRSPMNREALETARKADVILTSVGSIADRSWEDIIGTEKIGRLRDLGCVGHIGGHFFDINGQEIQGKYKNLLVGLSMDEIRNVHDVLCAAASPTKAEAVYGALHTGTINALFITEDLAEKLLATADNRIL